MDDFKQCCGWMMITIICLLGCIVLMMAIKMFRKALKSCRATKSVPDETLRRAVQDSERKVGWYGDNRYSVVSKGIQPSRNILDACNNGESAETHGRVDSSKNKGKSVQFSDLNTPNNSSSLFEDGGENIMVPGVLSGKTASIEEKKTLRTDNGLMGLKKDERNKTNDVFESWILAKVDASRLTQEQASKVANLPKISNDLYGVARVVPSTCVTQHDEVSGQYELASAPENQDQHEKCPETTADYAKPLKHKAHQNGEAKIEISTCETQQEGPAFYELASAPENQHKHEKCPETTEDYAIPWERKGYLMKEDYDLAQSCPNDIVIADVNTPNALVINQKPDIVTTNF